MESGGIDPEVRGVDRHDGTRVPKKMSSLPTFTRAQESRILFVLAAVQFVNVLDFMMVMPLGPDFSLALSIEASHLGWIGGSYTASAAVSGFLGSFFLDRYDRKQAMLWCLLGLAVATLLGGLAYDFESLMAARILAGLFGGPAATLTFAMAIDVVPTERRGRAMGTLLSAFSIASVFGVPAGLELARLGGWPLPFFGVGALAFLVLFGGFRWLPSMTSHVARARTERSGAAALALLVRKEVWYAYLCVSFAMMAGFMIIPNMAAYLQFNLGFPRANLGLLYLLGGLSSFTMMLLSGRLVDRCGSTFVTGLATTLLITVIFAGFFQDPPWLPVWVIFVGFMTAMGVRGVATSAAASKVPEPHERARFASFFSVFQHAASAAGAFVSAFLLSADEAGKLLGMHTVAGVSMGLSVFIMVWMIPLERRIRRGF